LLEPHTPEIFRAMGRAVAAAGLLGRHEAVARFALRMLDQVPTDAAAKRARVIALCRALEQLVESDQEPIAAKLAGALADPGDDVLESDSVRARLVLTRGVHAASTGQLEAHVSYTQEALELFVRLGEARNEARARSDMGAALIRLGDYGPA